MTTQSERRDEVEKVLKAAAKEAWDRDMGPYTETVHVCLALYDFLTQSRETGGESCPKCEEMAERGMKEMGFTPLAAPSAESYPYGTPPDNKELD